MWMLCARIPSPSAQGNASACTCLHIRVPDETAFERSHEESRKGCKVTGAKKWECGIAEAFCGLTNRNGL